MTSKIGIFTGTRADFGLLYRTIHLLQNDKRFDTAVFVTGSHLSPEYGMTISEIEEAGIINIIPVEILISSSSRVGVAKTSGIATIAFADAFSRENLDCIIILGDRYEALSAAQTAMLLDIPIAHIHGGEVTHGAFDDSIRHAISKLANIHFPATKQFAQRLIQLGESEESIFISGSPGVDNIINGKRMSKEKLSKLINLDKGRKICLVTYHPVTRATQENENDVTQLIDAMEEMDYLDFIVTYPNADGGEDIIKELKKLSKTKNIILVPSLGFEAYLTIMENVECVIGNSSSGLLEAPSFGVGTVNIGTRQSGRPKSPTVIDTSMNKNEIITAVNECCDDKFKSMAKHAKNPYGDGNASKRILEVLSSINFKDFSIKKFVDRF